MFSLKKLSAVLCAALILTLCGCENSDQPLQTDSDGNTISDEELTGWRKLYNTFCDEKQQVCSRADSLLNSSYSAVNDSIALLYALQGDVELSYTAKFFSENDRDVVTAMAAYGFENVTYTATASTASVSCIKNDVPFEFILEFDEANSAAELTVKKNGETALIYSLRKSGEYIAKTCRDIENELYIELLAYPATNNLYMSWTKETRFPVSLLGNYPLNESFAAFGKYRFTCVDGTAKGTYGIDPDETTAQSDKISQ